jgi:hypothetical protein
MRLLVIGAVLMSRVVRAQPSTADGAQPSTENPTNPPSASEATPPLGQEPLPPAPPPVVSNPADNPSPVVEPSPLSRIQIHGFASEGGFVSTANNYIGNSARGSLEFFEAGINFSTEITDRLRVGVQLFGRDEGEFKDLPPRLDWAYLDYRWKDWLGLRGGIIKMPFGLYNEFVDIDSSRVAILMPQSVYPLRDRSALNAQTGFSIYGNIPLPVVGQLEYQAWLGTLDVPNNALEVENATLNSTDTKYVTGVQLFWHPPVDGLRVGATYLRASIDFNLTFDPSVVAQLIALNYVPSTYNGSLLVSVRPDQAVVGSAEYIYGDWLFAAEYSRWFQHETTSLSVLLPPSDLDNERFYVLATRALPRHLSVGAYYSVFNADANDRHGSDTTKFPERFLAFQRDLAASARYDINDHWLFKLEAHYIDGAADLDPTVLANAMPTRYWGMFLFRTTVTF